MIRKFTFYSLVFILISASINVTSAQVSIIKGTVVDKDTGEPLAGASVYFAETTIGTMAEKKGDYLLEVRKPGNYELIVSMVGYAIQKRSMQIVKGETYKEDFKLVQKALNITAVEVQGEDQDEWRSNLKKFTRKFMGDLEASEYCEIENKEIINFKWNGDTLKAWAGKPVLIRNDYLGYRIICEIADYKYVPVTTYQEYAIFSRFEELVPKDESQKSKWESNREKMFYGSPVHFLWALRHDRLLEERFVVFITNSNDPKSQGPFKEVKTWLDIKYADQFLEEPILSFDAFLKIRYNDMQVSFVRSRFPMFTIDSYGIADNHLPFLCFGYWSHLGMATMLPRGYLPERIKNSDIAK